MVEVEPGTWVAPTAVVLLQTSVNNGTLMTVSTGEVLRLESSPRDVAKKLHFITEWKHPPGQRPPE